MLKQGIIGTINTGDYAFKQSLVLLLFRVTVGAFMLSHGMGKFYKLFNDDPISFPDPLGVGATASLALTVFSEVLCSLFLIFGFMTRLASIPLIITMVVAAFIIHGQDEFGKKELALLYMVIYLAIGILGAGKYSIDQWLSKNFIKKNY